MILPSLSRVKNQNHIFDEYEELDMNIDSNVELVDFSNPISDSEFDLDNENYWKSHIDNDYYDNNNRRRLENELRSPTEGSDISTDEKKQSLLNCHNQTLCIEPHLELEPVYNVYYCSHNANTGVRFYYVIREGLILHPNLHLVDSPDKADILVYLPESMKWSKSECGKSKYYSKLLILDEGDWPDLFTPDGYSPKQLALENKSKHGLNATKTLNSWHLLYFKRSYIRRKAGDFKGLMGWVKKVVWNNVLPMTYPAANAYIYSPYKHHPQLQLQLQSQSQTKVQSQGSGRRLKLESDMNSWLSAMNISTDPPPGNPPPPPISPTSFLKIIHNIDTTTTDANTKINKNDKDIKNMKINNKNQNKNKNKNKKNQKKIDKMKNVQKVKVKVDQKVFQSKSSPTKRVLQVLCTLRGSRGDPNRLRIQQWVQEYAKTRNISKENWVAHQINHESRRTISKGYFGKMQQAQIVVTANPSGWEGDFRLMEAMSSGAMIMVDTMRVPRPFPLKHEQHIVYYNNRNKTEFFHLLDKYRDDIHARNGVAVNGYLHVLKYHRAISFIDFVFRTLHIKLAKDAGESHPNYTDDGFQLRQKLINSNNKEARLQQKMRNN